MADENQPAPAAGASPTPTNEGADVTTPPNPEVEGLKKQLNSLAATVRKLSQATPAPAAQVAAPADESTEPKTLKELRAEIAREREEARKEREEAARIKRENGIRDAIKANNVDPDAVDLLFDHIQQRHGSKISQSEGKTILTDELGEAKEIGDFIGELLKTPKGKFFKPEKTPGPNTRAGRGGSSAIPGQKNFLEMSLEERLALPRDQARALASQAYQKPS